MPRKKQEYIETKMFSDKETLNIPLELQLYKIIESVFVKDSMSLIEMNERTGIMTYACVIFNKAIYTVSESFGAVSLKIQTGTLTKSKVFYETGGKTQDEIEKEILAELKKLIIENKYQIVE